MDVPMDLALYITIQVNNLINDCFIAKMWAEAGQFLILTKHRDGQHGMTSWGWEYYPLFVLSPHKTQKSINQRKTLDYQLSYLKSAVFLSPQIQFSTRPRAMNIQFSVWDDQLGIERAFQ